MRGIGGNRSTLVEIEDKVGFMLRMSGSCDTAR